MVYGVRGVNDVVVEDVDEEEQGVVVELVNSILRWVDRSKWVELEI